MEADSDGFIHTPPDTHAAVGPDRIVEVTNGHVAIYGKAGTVIAGGDSGAGAVDLNAFCNGEVNGCFDPKVIYDQESGRFVAVALEVDSSTHSPSTSFLHVMVSNNSTPSNLTTDWDKFRQAASATISSTDGWFDYPGLGVSPDAVVVTGNIFPAAGPLLGTKIRVYDKAELYDGDATATFSDIDSTVADGAFTVQPAHHFGSPSAGTFYLIQRWNTVRLRVVALTGVPGSPSVDGFLLPTSDQGVCVSGAPQQGTSKLVGTVCPRMMNAVWRDGSLWGTLTGSDATDSRAVVQWFEVKTNNFPSSSPTLLQHGVIDGGTGEYTFMPSISVDGCGNAATTYTQSSSTRFPEMRYTGRLAGDALNTMQTPAVAKTSDGFHDDFSPDPERWGDYSATVVDPSDQSFWIAHEYVKVAPSGGGNNGRWGTWLANIGFSCIPKDPGCDYNNDGLDDLAIGVPGEDIGAIKDAGAVNVLYGSGSGQTATGDQLWHQNTPGVLGGAEAGDVFGDNVTCGDFDGDGFDDLAVGVPGEDIGAVVDGGAVNVFYGSASGLTASGDQLWHQNVPGVLGGAEAGDLFGSSLASGDYDGNGRDDLAVGAPGEDVGALVDAGAVNVLYGSGSRLTASGDQLWHQDSAGILGGAEAGDMFGS